MLKPVTYVLAAVYFLVDAIFLAIAKPISDWLGRHVLLRRLRDWIRSLDPYPSLALFAVPVILLEPVKPVAAYHFATGQFATGAIVLVVGELLKLVLVERLFSLTKDKLLQIRAFAWAYGRVQDARSWLENTEAWQAIIAVRRAIGRYFAEMKMSAAARLVRRSKSRRGALRISAR